MRTALYRHYDLNNVLLYVGVSLSTMTRFNQHIQCSDWATDSARMDIEWFDTREMALDAEKKAIKNESPRFNISHSLINKPTKKIKSNREELDDVTCSKDKEWIDAYHFPEEYDNLVKNHYFKKRDTGEILDFYDGVKRFKDAGFYVALKGRYVDPEMVFHAEIRRLKS
jgi:hypothetical protein